MGLGFFLHVDDGYMLILDTYIVSNMFPDQIVVTHGSQVLHTPPNIITTSWIKDQEQYQVSVKVRVLT